MYTLLYKQKFSSTPKDMESWIELFKIVKKYWFSSNISSKLWEVRNKSDGKWLFESLTHDINSDISSVTYWTELHQNKDHVDYQVFVRTMTRIITNIACVEAIVMLEENV